MSSQYIPSTQEEYMNDSQLQYFKTKLMALKRDYETTSEVRLLELNSVKSDLNDDTYNGSYMEVDLLNEDNHVQTQKEVEESLKRIDNGSYGYCEDTGAEIGVKRLLANPIARYCIKAQENREREQEILYKLGNRYGDKT